MKRSAQDDFCDTSGQMSSGDFCPATKKLAEPQNNSCDTGSSTRTTSFQSTDFSEIKGNSSIQNCNSSVQNFFNQPKRTIYNKRKPFEQSIDNFFEENKIQLKSDKAKVRDE